MRRGLRGNATKVCRESRNEVQERKLGRRKYVQGADFEDVGGGGLAGLLVGGFVVGVRGLADFDAHAVRVEVVVARVGAL